MTDCKTVFLDTAPIIYFLQKSPQYFEVIRSFILRQFQKGTVFKTSTITIEEYLVYPYRHDEPNVRENFFSFLEELEVEVIPIDISIAESAARIRSKYEHFKGMDALQLAAFLSSGCDVFLTNDKQLTKFVEGKVITVESLMAD